MNSEATRVQGQFIRDVIKRNPKNFRVFSPDEISSNRWGAVFEITNRCSTAEIISTDDRIAPNGRVMEMLSEHQCESWLEGYLLTGRHGFFPAMRHSSISLIRCSTSMRNGSRWRIILLGDGRFVVPTHDRF